MTTRAEIEALAEEMEADVTAWRFQASKGIGPSAADLLGHIEGYAATLLAALPPETAPARLALEKIAAPDRVLDPEEDGTDCMECGAIMATEDGLDPAPECWPCSSRLLAEAREIARAALAPASPPKAADPVDPEEIMP